MKTIDDIMSMHEDCCKAYLRWATKESGTRSEIAAYKAWQRRERAFKSALLKHTDIRR